MMDRVSMSSEGVSGAHVCQIVRQIDAEEVLRTYVQYGIGLDSRDDSQLIISW